VVDVGDARNERNKWIHVSEKVDAVIYLAPLADYDRVMFEDWSTNRMKESLTLFDEFVNQVQWFRDLTERIKVSPISDYFPDFEGSDDDVQAAIEFFKNEHLSDL
jgi:hypothetical protein